MEIFAKSTFCDRARSSSRSIGPSNPSNRRTRFSEGPSGAAMSDDVSIDAIDVTAGQPEQGPERPGEDVFQGLPHGIEAADQPGQDEYHHQDDHDADFFQPRPDFRQFQRQ